ncbi:hypothetical protein EIP86_011228 [Pleurotus ostreatoroseus]|nr:hypothetical protein EIP86_011228 [Pleurotus ostreatoroseus]
MEDLHSWRKYARRFIRIEGWLERKLKISQDECAMYFWKGIPCKFRERLEHYLMSQSLMHDISKPFAIDDVEKVAKTLLQHDCFDSEHLPSDSDESDDSSSESDNDSNEDHKTKYKTSNKKSKKSKKHVRFDSDADSDTDKSEDELKHVHRKMKKAKTSPSKCEGKEDKEVEQLIEQLNKMSIHDPAYASMYFRAVTKNPIVHCDTDFDKDEFNEAYPCQVPSGNAILEEVTSESDEEYLASDSEAEMEGVFVPERKVYNKKIGRVDTSKQDFSIHRVAKNGARPNFLTPQTPIDVNQPTHIDVNDSDAFMEDNFAQPKRKATERPDGKRKTTEATEWEKRKPAQASKGDHKDGGNVTKKDHGEKCLPRVSDLQAQTNMNDVMNKILKAPVTMEVGEILRVFKEMAHQVAESLKAKSATKTVSKMSATADGHANVLAASLIPRTKETLIKLLLECDGRPINAILDTESQLNIVNKAY